MTAERHIFLYGAAAVLVIATVGAVAARFFGFQYWLLSSASLAIYFAAGAVSSLTGASIGQATSVGTAIGVVDVTLGWALSAAIGPGRIQDSPFTGFTAVIVGGLITLCVYTLVSAVGAVVGRRGVASPR